MLTVLWILFWLLVGLLVLITVLVLSPIYLRMTATSDPTPNFRMEIRLFSARAPRLFALDSRRMSRGDKPAKTRKKRDPEKKPKAKGSRRRMSSDRIRKIIREGPSVIRDTLRGIHIDFLRARGTFGLGDPADTGAVFGALAPLIYIPNSPRFSVVLTPDFETLGASGRGEFGLHFTPIRMTWPILRFAWRMLVARS